MKNAMTLIRIINDDCIFGVGVRVLVKRVKKIVANLLCGKEGGYPRECKRESKSEKEEKSTFVNQKEGKKNGADCRA